MTILAQSRCTSVACWPDAAPWLGFQGPGHPPCLSLPGVGRASSLSNVVFIAVGRVHGVGRSCEQLVTATWLRSRSRSVRLSVQCTCRDPVLCSAVTVAVLVSVVVV